mmetsp:Transcript_25759/g.63896  ORF Transcript_25759/g.63896 Transcript_25759/m.63896 type:complete len:177 (-) Transcript_25759:1322-1852(-)
MNESLYVQKILLEPFSKKTPVAGLAWPPRNQPQETATTPQRNRPESKETQPTDTQVLCAHASKRQVSPREKVRKFEEPRTQHQQKTDRHTDRLHAGMAGAPNSAHCRQAGRHTRHTDRQAGQPTHAPMQPPTRAQLAHLHTPTHDPPHPSHLIQKPKIRQTDRQTDRQWAGAMTFP